MKIKERFWILGIAVVALLIHFSLDGFDTFTAQSTLDINIYDTSFIIPHIHFFRLLLTGLFFSVYGVRTVHQKFRNLTVNVIFMLATISLIFGLLDLGLIVSTFARFPATTLYPPLTMPPEIHSGNTAGTYLLILHWLIGFISILLAYTGFKTGVQYAKKAR